MAVLNFSDHFAFKYEINVTQDEYDLLIALLNKVNVATLKEDEQDTLETLMNIEVF